MLLYEDHTPYEDHKGVVYALAFACDGSSLASGAKDGAVFLRDAGRSGLLERGPNSLPVYSVAYAPDGAVIVGGAFGWRGYRLHGKGEREEFGPTKIAPTTGLAILDDHTVAVGTGDRVKPSAGSFELWNLNSGRRREPHFLEPNGVRAVAACPERRMVAWVTGHRKVCVWEVPETRAGSIPPIEELSRRRSQPPTANVSSSRLIIRRRSSTSQKQTRVVRPQGRQKGPSGRWPSAPTARQSPREAGTGRLSSGAATGRERAPSRPIGRVYSLALRT